MVRLRENGPFRVSENGLFSQNGLFLDPFRNRPLFTTGPRKQTDNLTDFLLPPVVVLDLVHHWSPSDDVRDRRPCCPLPRPEPPPPVEDSDGLRERFPTSSSLKVEQIHELRIMPNHDNRTLSKKNCHTDRTFLMSRANFVSERSQ